MTLAPQALELIRLFEGYHERLPDGRCQPYRDPVGIPTVGVGSIWRMDGSRVEMADPPISYEHAMALLDREITHKCEPAIARSIFVDLHPLMHGALASFVYNLGGGALQASTLRKVINARMWGEVPGQLAKYRVAKGQVLPGLVRRRAAEAAMFMKGVSQMVTARTDPAHELRHSTDWITILARAA